MTPTPTTHSPNQRDPHANGSGEHTGLIRSCRASYFVQSCSPFVLLMTRAPLWPARHVTPACCSDSMTACCRGWWPPVTAAARPSSASRSPRVPRALALSPPPDSRPSVLQLRAPSVRPCCGGDGRPGSTVPLTAAGAAPEPSITHARTARVMAPRDRQPAVSMSRSRPAAE